MEILWLNMLTYDVQSGRPVEQSGRAGDGLSIPWYFMPQPCGSDILLVSEISM